MGKYFVLSNGVKMPKIGYGTFRCTDGGDEAVISAALEAGYRLLDTAAFYGNEDAIGRELAKCGIPRAEIFLTTKVWKADLGYEKTMASSWLSKPV